MVKNQSGKLPLANRSATWDKFSAAFKNYLRVHHISQVWTKANAPGVAPERLPAVEDEQELAAFVAKTPLTVHVGLDSGANLSARTCYYSPISTNKQHGSGGLWGPHLPRLTLAAAMPADDTDTA